MGKEERIGSEGGRGLSDISQPPNYSDLQCASYQSLLGYGLC